MLVKKGFVDKNKIWSFVKKYENELENERWNGKENNSGRKCIWLGIGVNLGFKNNLYKGLEINNGLKKRCNELWGGEDWNSILVYKYIKGCELKLHIDRNVFDNKVILINVCDEDLFGNGSSFIYDGNKYNLKNGEVIEFDNKKLHGVEKVSDERWSLSIRKVIL